MKLKKFPILVIVLVIFLVTIFVIGGINEKIQLQLDPLATILAVMGIGYTWWVDQNYQKSSIEGMLLNEMITNQSFKVKNKHNGIEYLCQIYQDDGIGRFWHIRFFHTEDRDLDWNEECLPKLTSTHGEYIKAKCIIYLQKNFHIIEIL